MSRKPQPPLTDAQRHDICEMLSSGASRASAAQFAGCHGAALRAEMRRNLDFANRVLQAELNLESTLLRAIRSVAEKDPKQWRAAAWALERIYPNRYAKRRTNTLTVDQVHEFISEVSEIVASELPVPRFRERIFHRLAVLFATARNSSSPHSATENAHVPPVPAKQRRRIAGPSDGISRHGQTDAPEAPSPTSSEPTESTGTPSA
jgi:hypothetical protein